ncbi:MAG: hypothetical protein WDZ49_07460 [Litorilinea sp.]
MSRPEDFDIVDDEEELPRRMPAWWLWLGGATLLIVLAGVFALSTFSQRVNSPAPTPPATVIAAVPATTGASVATAPATQTPEPSPVASATTTATTTATPTPPGTSTPEPSPTPCPIPVSSLFTAAYNLDEMGCAQNQDRIVWSAWQPFERGFMFWRSDTDQALVLSNGGIYSPVTDRWDGSAGLDRGAPPPGLITPERGFGFVWSRSDEIFNMLGWAVTPERGFCARIQDFDYGAMIASEPVPSCTSDNLYNYATAGDWQPLNFRLNESGSWR